MKIHQNSYNILKIALSKFLSVIKKKINKKISDDETSITLTTKEFKKNPIKKY